MKKTASFWEYKVDINAIIANFMCMCMWKSRMELWGSRLNESIISLKVRKRLVMSSHIALHQTEPILVAIPC